MPQPKDTPGDEPQPEAILICQVCGRPASVVVNDLREGTPAVDRLGAEWATYSIIGRHVFCLEHDRPAVVIPLGGSMSAAEPPTGFPWPIGGVVRFKGVDRIVLGYPTADTVTLQATGEDAPELRFVIKNVEIWIAEQTAADEHHRLPGPPPGGRGG